MVNLSKFVNMPETFISVDASTNNIAYAVFKNQELVAYDKIHFTGTNVFQKIGSAVIEVHNVFKYLGVQALVIERAIFINSPKTMSELSMVQGAILAGAALAGVKVFKGTNPIAWQTFIGNGKLTKDAKLLMRSKNPGRSESWYKNFERDQRKQRTISFVNINYDINIDDNDIADAIGIGHYSLKNWDKLGD